MKLTKININELANADLNECEMCRLLGGSGSCQCSCAGSSTTGTNNSTNDAGNLSSTTASSANTNTYDCNCDNIFRINDNYSYCQSADCNGTEVHGCSCTF